MAPGNTFASALLASALAKSRRLLEALRCPRGASLPSLLMRGPLMASLMALFTERASPSVLAHRVALQAARSHSTLSPRHTPTRSPFQAVLILSLVAACSVAISCNREVAPGPDV